jgi:hypothetical protein
MCDAPLRRCIHRTNPAFFTGSRWRQTPASKCRQKQRSQRISKPARATERRGVPQKNRHSRWAAGKAFTAGMLAGHQRAMASLRGLMANVNVWTALWSMKKIGVETHIDYDSFAERRKLEGQRVPIRVMCRTSNSTAIDTPSDGRSEEAQTLETHGCVNRLAGSWSYGLDSRRRTQAISLSAATR